MSSPTLYRHLRSARSLIRTVQYTRALSIMPKAELPPLPLSGLFGIEKPSGPTSMSVVTDIKHLMLESKLFVDGAKLEEDRKNKAKGAKRSRRARDLKIGQGGTLDPLADGVLVIGVNKGTKKLSDFLDCTKEYYTTCLLGCETDTYDSQGKRVRVAPWKHVTREQVERALDQFRGDIIQTPPIFSALKMDGKPLYEYAREGKPLPRPIEKRNVTVHNLEIVEWKGSDHDFKWPEKEFTVEEKAAMAKTLESVEAVPAVADEPTEEGVPTAFVLKMTVTGGTYVRSIVHDVAHVVGSAGHVVTLQRSRQGRFALKPEEIFQVKEVESKEPAKGVAATKGTIRGCLPWDIIERARTDLGEADEDGWHEWERAVIERIEVI